MEIAERMASEVDFAIGLDTVPWRKSDGAVQLLVEVLATRCEEVPQMSRGTYFRLFFVLVGVGATSCSGGSINVVQGALVLLVVDVVSGYASQRQNVVASAYRLRSLPYW